MSNPDREVTHSFSWELGPQCWIIVYIRHRDVARRAASRPVFEVVVKLWNAVKAACKARCKVK